MVVTQSIIDKIVDAYKGGATLTDLSQTFGISDVSIRKYVRRARVERPARISESIWQEIQTAYSTGKTVDSLSKAFGIHKTTIYTRLRQTVAFDQPKRLTDEEKSKVVSLFVSGLSGKQVATICGISVSTACDTAKAGGFTFNLPHLSDEQRNQIVDLYQSGKTLSMVSRVINRPIQTVSRVVKKAGLLRTFNQKGENSHRWKGGRTELKTAIRGTAQYKKWRLAVFERDEFTCQHCRQNTPEKRRTIQADHIYPFAKIISIYNLKTINNATGCAFLWDVNNGRTLCSDCHKLTETYGSKPKGVWRVLQVCPKTNDIVNIWDSTTQAAEVLDINRDCIVRACDPNRKKYTTYKGYNWQHL